MLFATHRYDRIIEEKCRVMNGLTVPFRLHHMDISLELRRRVPIASASDLGSVPADLIGAFQPIFYNSVEDAIFKALGVE